MTSTLARETPLRRILFAKLGSFSYTNEHVEEQLARQFPHHQIEVFDVKGFIKSKPASMALNGVIEAALYGPGVLVDPAERHKFFFLTPYMFEHLSTGIAKTFAPRAADFDFVIQTQGMFNARVPGVPLLIYTDYTFLDNLEEPHYDPRLFRSRTYLQQEAALFREADAIATMGAYVADTLVQRYGCEPGRVCTVHTGANIDIPANPDESHRRPRHVLFVGVEWERKGGPILVEAFTRLADAFPDAHLTIAGCSPQLSHPRITVLGRIPRIEMNRHFESASIFCMPSTLEPLGIAAVEASLFRLPVVASRLRGFGETVTDGETGLLVPPGNIDALTEALRRLFEAPDLVRKMGEAGFARNCHRFTWNSVGERLRALAESVVPRLATA
jgi:glycosyltransferase involved in cell wall biosynthesis